MCRVEGVSPVDPVSMLSTAGTVDSIIAAHPTPTAQQSR